MQGVGYVLHCSFTFHQTEICSRKAMTGGSNKLLFEHCPLCHWNMWKRHTLENCKNTQLYRIHYVTCTQHVTLHTFYVTWLPYTMYNMFANKLRTVFCSIIATSCMRKCYGYFVWFNILQKIGCICCTDNGNSLGVVLHRSNFFGSAFIYNRTHPAPCTRHTCTDEGKHLLPGNCIVRTILGLSPPDDPKTDTRQTPPPPLRVRWLWVALRRLDDYIWNPSDPGLYCLLNLWSVVDQLFSCGCQKLKWIRVQKQSNQNGKTTTSTILQTVEQDVYQIHWSNFVIM